MLLATATSLDGPKRSGRPQTKLADESHEGA